MKNIRIIYLKIFIFLIIKFSVYFNRRVFIMVRLNNKYSKTERKRKGRKDEKKKKKEEKKERKTKAAHR